MVTSLNAKSSEKPYHLIVDTSTYLRLLAATPGLESVYCPGYLSIIEVMTKKGLVRPIFTSEVLSEILNSAAVISKNHIFKFDQDSKMAKSFVPAYDMKSFIKPFSRLEFLRRIYNSGAIFMPTDVGGLYLDAMKKDKTIKNLVLNCGLKVKDATPDVLNNELLKWKENSHVVEALKKRRLRGDIGEISCGEAALKVNGKVRCSILFQGNDVRSRAIYRAGGFNPFEDAVMSKVGNDEGHTLHKPIPCEFNPHRKSFNHDNTKPIENVGCLSTTAFLLPFMLRSKQDGLDSWLISKNEANDPVWYRDKYPENSLRGHLLNFLRDSSSRVGGKNYREYDALKDIYFGQVGVEVKHEHSFVDNRYHSPWFDFIFSLDKSVFKDLMTEIRQCLDNEIELYKKSSVPHQNSWQNRVRSFTPSLLLDKLPASVAR